jgi:radical SAM protein with 4Fe4S-binding SPASM domain
MSFNIKKFNIPLLGRIFTDKTPEFDKYAITYDNFNKSYNMSKAHFSKEDKEIVDIMAKSLQETKKLPFSLLPTEITFLQHNHLATWCEYLIFRYKLRVYPKMKKVSNFPVYMLIEPVSACNLRCIMCFQSDKTFTKKPYMGTMSLELFKSVIDEAVEGGTKAITLASRGEPTMNKNLGKMLEYAKDKFFEVKLNTNGTKMTEKLCHEILSSGVTELVWSIDAPKKELYEKIRLKGKFDVVIKNIKMFNDIKEKHYPDSILKTTAGGVMFHEEQDIQEFTNFFNNLADNVTAQTIENRWNTYENEVTPEIDSPCEYLWERMYVWFDGKCNPCDVDYKSVLQVGDIGNNSIKEIWHGEIYQKLRDDHKKKERKKWSPCDRCGIG